VESMRRRGAAISFRLSGGLNAAEAEEGAGGCAGAAMPAGGASGTNTPRREAAEGASGIDNLSKPTALKRGISCTTDALRTDMRHAMVPSPGPGFRESAQESRPGHG